MRIAGVLATTTALAVMDTLASVGIDLNGSPLSLPLDR